MIQQYVPICIVLYIVGSILPPVVNVIDMCMMTRNFVMWHITMKFQLSLGSGCHMVLFVYANNLLDIKQFTTCSASLENSIHDNIKFIFTV